MSRAIAIEKNGDTIIDSAGRIETLSGTDKIIQDLKILLRSVKSSCPFDTSFGIEDLSKFHNRGTRLISSAIQAALQQHSAVLEVQDIKVLQSGRTATVSATIILTDKTRVDFEVSL